MIKPTAYFSSNLFFSRFLSFPLNGIDLQLAIDIHLHSDVDLLWLTHPSAGVVCHYCRNNEKQPKTILHMSSSVQIGFGFSIMWMDMHVCVRATTSDRFHWRAKPSSRCRCDPITCYFRAC